MARRLSDDAPIVRKAAFAGFSWLLGIFLCADENVGFAAAAAVLLISAAAAVRLWGKKTALFCISAAILGAVYSAVYSAAVYRPVTALVGETVSFSGKITEIREYESDIMGLEAVGKLGSIGNVKLIIYSDSAVCRVGDGINASGKISEMTDSYTFPAKSYYRSRGIFVKMNRPETSEIIHSDGFSLIRAASECSDYVCRTVKDTLPGEEGDMLCAMLTGDRSGMEDTVRTKLFRAGCGHIMAVSGIHLTVLFTVISSLITMTGLFGRRTVFLICIPFVIFFCLTAGASPSAVRAAVMLILLNAGVFAGRRSDTMNSLGAAAFVLTMQSPYAVFDSGMILSFAGVIGISVIAPKISARYAEYSERFGRKLIPVKTADTIAGAFSVSMAVFPFTLFIYDEAPLISPVTNIIMLPLCTAALVIGGAGAAVGILPVISRPLIIAAGLFCKPVLAWADAVYSVNGLFVPSDPYAVRYISAALCFGSAALLIFHSDAAKAVMISLTAIFLGISSVTIYHAAAPADRVRFAFLSGNSCAAVIVHNGHTASVFDVYGSGRSAAMCAKYLTRNGIGGADMLYLGDKPLSAYAAFEDKLGFCGTASVFCGEADISGFTEFGEGIVLDTGYFRVSHGEYGELEFLINDNVLEIFTQNGESHGNVLFTAACGKNAEVFSDSEYSEISCGGHFTDGRSGYLDNVCTEFVISPERVKAEVIFDGGSD